MSFAIIKYCTYHKNIKNYLLNFHKYQLYNHNLRCISSSQLKKDLESSNLHHITTQVDNKRNETNYSIKTVLNTNNNIQAITKSNDDINNNRIKNLSKETDRNILFMILHLKTFSNEEIKKSFINILCNQNKLNYNNITSMNISNIDSEYVNINNGLDELYLKYVNSTETNMKDKQKLDRIKRIFNNSDINLVNLNYKQYKKCVLNIAEKLDSRVWNLGVSFLFTGISVGIIIPCMPLMVSQLNIPPTEFGLIVSAFGLSKLIGNIPSGYLVEKYGRKPIIVSGLGLCAVGLGSIGFALLPGFGTPWLISCRFISGLGVSAFIAGGYMFMSDISNPLNRTRTIAPVMAGFSSGAAFGPAIGGFLVDAIGIPYTYSITGGLFFTLAMMNAILLNETKSTATISTTASSSDNNNKDIQDTGILGSFKAASSAWYQLLHSSNPQIYNVVVLNGFYWFVLSGTQMTLLPLIMVSPMFGLQMDAYQIGGCFAFMSVVSVVSSQPLAYLSDKYGNIQSMIAGFTLLSTSMFALSTLAATTTAAAVVASTTETIEATTSYLYLLPILLPFSLGSTIMNSTPNALIANATNNSERAQGLSLLRTSGDFGLLLGASCSGSVAYLLNIENALQMNGIITSGVIIWFTMRNWKYLSTIYTNTTSDNNTNTTINATTTINNTTNNSYNTDNHKN